MKLTPHAHRMVLSRPLAKVEWQLIMSFCCDRLSLLLLARVCRATLAAASSDMAWSALSPVIFRSTRPRLAHNITTSLLRYAHIGVRWCVTQKHQHLAVSDAELRAIADVPRLVYLDASGRQGESKNRLLPRLLRLLSAPQHLTILHSFFSLDTAALGFLADNCPSLRTLSLVDDGNDDEGDDFVNALTRNQSLTDLTLRVTPDVAAHVSTRYAPLFTSNRKRDI